MILDIACEGCAAASRLQPEPGVTERPLASGKRAPLGIAALAAIGGRALARGGGVQPMWFKMKRLTRLRRRKRNPRGGCQRPRLRLSYFGN